LKLRDAAKNALADIYAVAFGGRITHVQGARLAEDSDKPAWSEWSEPEKYEEIRL